MRSKTDAVDLDVMHADARGPVIEQRRLDLGVKSLHAMARIAAEEGFELSREGITSAERGRAADATYKRYDALLRRLEERQGRIDPDEDDGLGESGDENKVTFEITSNAGVEIVVRGPIANTSELIAAVTKLARDLGESK